MFLDGTDLWYAGTRIATGVTHAVGNTTGSNNGDWMSYIGASCP
ncbi:hypothetical protein [Microbacterium sp.]|nr:hypothetical protein [Microbacterium sp.]